MNALYDTKKTNFLYGKVIRDQILSEVSAEIDELKKKNLAPFLMTLEVGNDPATAVYKESQRKLAAQIGINYETIELSKNTSQERLLKMIDRINRDPVINGLMVHMPLPEHIDAREVQWSINSFKDVEGVTPYNMGKLFLGAEALYPCTAEAIMALIKSTGVDLRGKEATVVGSSSIVGRPVATMLLKEEATVSVCHYATSQRGMLEHHVRNAEILVVAAGVPNLIPGEWVKEGAIVIDAGINRVGKEIVGDVDFEGASRRASYITPVPGGVGAVTVAYLMKNTVTALKRQIAAKHG